MVLLKYLFVIGLILTISLISVAKCDEDAENEVADEDQPGIGWDLPLDQPMTRRLITSPEFCPSNYRVDRNGKCRRIV